MSTTRGWESASLQDVAQVVNGGTPLSGIAGYWDGDVQWLTPKDMGQMRGREIGSTPRTISQAGLRNSSARLVPENSIILSTRAPIGHLAINTQPMAFNQGCRGIVPGDRLNHQFLYYFLLASRRQLDDLGTGATFKELSAGALKSFVIPLPQVDEQKRIVAVLDQAFAALDRVRANAAANLADIRELHAQATEDILSNAALGEYEPCGTHVELLSGFAFKSAGYSEKKNDIRLVRGDNIVQGAFRWAGVVRWPASDRALYKKYELAKGDVLVAMDRTWVSSGMKYAVVDEDALPSLLVQRVARMRTFSSLLPGYLARWIGSPIFERYVLSIQKGLGVPHVSGGQIESFQMRVPSLKRQSEVIEQLDEISSSCRHLSAINERKLADIAALRQSLLQAAFSGQLT